MTFPYSNTNLQGSHNIISCFMYLYYFILVKLQEFDIQILIPLNHGVTGRIERIHCGPVPHQHKGSFTQEAKNTSLWFIFNERHTESSKLQAVLVAVKTASSARLVHLKSHHLHSFSVINIIIWHICYTRRLAIWLLPRFLHASHTLNMHVCSLLII